MMMRTFDHIIGIDLQETEVIDYFENSLWSFAKLSMSGEPRGVNDDSAGLFRGQCMDLHDSKISRIRAAAG